MSMLENFMTVLHSDPETLPGVPSNEEIIENSPDLKMWKVSVISEAERTGYLIPWRFKHARQVISELETPNLETLYTAAREEFYDPGVLASRFDGLRFILIAAGQTIAARQMQNKEI